MKTNHTEVIDRNWLCQQPVMLNGQPARIVSGGLEGFPSVVQTASGLGAEWSWKAIDYVVRNKNGKFVS